MTSLYDDEFVTLLLARLDDLTERKSHMPPIEFMKQAVSIAKKILKQLNKRSQSSTTNVWDLIYESEKRINYATGTLSDRRSVIY